MIDKNIKRLPCFTSGLLTLGDLQAALIASWKWWHCAQSLRRVMSQRKEMLETGHKVLIIKVIKLEY